MPPAPRGETISYGPSFVPEVSAMRGGDYTGVRRCAQNVQLNDPGKDSFEGVAGKLAAVNGGGRETPQGLGNLLIADGASFLERFSAEHFGEERAAGNRRHAALGLE